MRIGELARVTGVDIDTIRYYERDGLLPAPAREANGYRRYGPIQLERLAFIRHCRALDMPLSDIRRLLDFLAHPEAACDNINILVDTQLARVQARLRSLTALEKQLQALRRRCDHGHATGDCGILQELIAAAHGEACACHESTA